MLVGGQGGQSVVRGALIDLLLVIFRGPVDLGHVVLNRRFGLKFFRWSFWALLSYFWRSFGRKVLAMAFTAGAVKHLFVWRRLVWDMRLLACPLHRCIAYFVSNLAIFWAVLVEHHLLILVPLIRSLSFPVPVGPRSLSLRTLSLMIFISILDSMPLFTLFALI